MAKIEMSKVREHNRAVKAGRAEGLHDPHDVRETVEESLSEFMKEVIETRQGLAQDERGNKIPARDLSLARAAEEFYGADFNTFMREIGVFSDADTLYSMGEKFGLNNLGRTSLEKLLIDHSNYAQPNSTKTYDPEHRFIIAEVMLQAVRTGYQNASMHENWIATTVNMTQQKLTMPRIERGDAFPRRVNEGAAIPKGSLRFGRKDVTVFKVGNGFDITDELITASTIDMVFEFLQEVGNDMSIGADVEAIRVLISGEQADLSESAPVIGVDDTTKGFQYKDLKRVFTRMSRLKRPATRVITGEEEGINITAIDKFEGYQGGDRLASIRSIIGVPDVFNNDVHVLPDDQILLLSPTQCMARLRHKGLLVERRRNPQTQVEELYVSDHIGFAILRRDARVILDKSVAYGIAGFPDYMDIDSRINESFKIS